MTTKGHAPGWPALVSHGLFGLPLAMLALPVYIYVAQLYAQRSSLDLAQIGAAAMPLWVALARRAGEAGAWVTTYALLLWRAPLQTRQIDLGEKT